MTDLNKKYQKLLEFSKTTRLLTSVSHLLEWDQETMMPPMGAAIRAEQLELLASLSHKERTSPRFVNCLAQFIDLETGKIQVPGLSAEKRATIKALWYDYTLAAALPETFVKKFAKITSEAMTVWGKAKKENHFSNFAPYLEKIVELSKEKAHFFGYKRHPYDALLRSFEPETSLKDILPLFNGLKNKIIPLIKEIQAAAPLHDAFLHGNFSVEKQLHFGKYLLQCIGYDFEKGRLDLSNHPFSMSLHPFDSRITTRIHPTSLFDCISVVLHEGGHSLYEMGLKPEHYGSPLCEAISYGIHESQSRMWETLVGQSLPFWTHFFPKLQKTFPKLQEVSLESFYKAINKVIPSFIRVESDEIHYSLHIIIRLELEVQLIEGSLQVSEIPDAWNHLMETYLGIRPTTDREGCLQDVHWSMGAIGYFPTYILGNLYSAQFFQAFMKEHSNWAERFARGEILFLKDWLKENIHQYGRFYTANTLVKKVTGKKLSAQPYLDYLYQKYTQLYSLGNRSK